MRSNAHLFHRIFNVSLALSLLLSLFLLEPSAITHAQTPAEIGEWGPILDWAIQGKHMSVLPTGKVLVWSTGNNARVWDPADGSFTLVPAVFGDLHCAAEATLADGRVIVLGGQLVTPHIGIKVNALFDPFTNTWTQGADMNYARWYATATALADGRVLVSSGIDALGMEVTTPEIYDPVTDTWTQLTGASDRAQTLYPFMFVLPNGKVYDSGTRTDTALLDLSGTGSWTSGPTNWIGSIGYDESGAMYEPGKIIRSGGYNPARARATIVDMTAATPQWEEISPMAFPRRRHNLVILADGTVMAVGGTRQDDLESQAVLEGEIWDPVTKLWTTVAAMSEARMYHSTAALLPDGRVLTAGGEAAGRLHAQIYSPPYLFKGLRPAISSSPTTAPYSTTFTVNTPDAANIVSVALIRPAAVTHAFDHNQRYVPLTYTVSSNLLTVTAPANGNIAPPGYYMLVIKNTTGVPSVASWIRVDSSANLLPGAITGQVTDSGTTAGIPGATVSYSGGITTTDASGIYTLTDVLAGEHEVTVSASGYATVSKAQTVTSGGISPLDFALSPPGTITGTVTDSSTGNGIAGTTILYSGGSTTTDASGNYTATVPSGNQTLTASAVGYENAQQSIPVPPNGSATLNFALLQKPAFIAGQVVDLATGEVIVSATVSYGGGAMSTDALGRYMFTNVPPGTYTVIVSSPGYVSVSQSAIVTLGAPAYSDFSLDVPAVIFTPTADAYTSSVITDTNKNFGVKTVLKLDKDPVSGAPLYNSYLRFNVTGAPFPVAAQVVEGSVRSVKLRLYVTNVSDQGGAVYLVANTYQGTSTPWTELGLTFDNAPVITGTMVDSVGTAPLDTWVEFDVKSVVTGNGIYNFGLKATSTDRIEYSSKEGSNPPQLVIQSLMPSAASNPNQVYLPLIMRSP